MTHNVKLVMIDNVDSFVYNLVDALRPLSAAPIVLRNTVGAAEVVALQPELVVLSPGPGRPEDAGNLMEILAACLREGIPVLGICLGFQAMVAHFGGCVEPCGPVHGTRDTLRAVAAPSAAGGEGGGRAAAPKEGGRSAGSAAPSPTDPAAGSALVSNPHELAERLGLPGASVARYHSLGAVTVPAPLVPLAVADSQIGEVVMAAAAPGALGLQFHPESIVTTNGPEILSRAVDYLLRSSSRPADLSPNDEEPA